MKRIVGGWNGMDLQPQTVDGSWSGIAFRPVYPISNSLVAESSGSVRRNAPSGQSCQT